MPANLDQRFSFFIMDLWISHPKQYLLNVMKSISKRGFQLQLGFWLGRSHQNNGSTHCTEHTTHIICHVTVQTNLHLQLLSNPTLLKLSYTNNCTTGHCIPAYVRGVNDPISNNLMSKAVYLNCHGYKLNCVVTNVTCILHGWLS